MTENGKSGSFQRELTISQDDEDVYEDDSDFEYLNVPAYEFTDGNEPPKGLASEDAQIPFSAIHKAPLPYNSDDRVCFIPNQRVEVDITDVERTDHKVLNPNLYTIQVSHGPFKWTIKRRYKHFRSLHDQLVLFRAKLHLPVPTRRHRIRRQTFKERRESLPRFPRRPEMLVDEDEIPERKKQLRTYLQRILRIPVLRNHHETLNFFEVSHLSFVSGLGAKFREGLIKKRSGGRSITGCCGCCGDLIKNVTAHYNKRWFVLKDTFLAYINPHQGTVSDVLLMDGRFNIECGLLNTGVRHGLEIASLNRQLMLKGWTQRSALEWKDAILDVAATVAKDFTTPNRHESFAPQRPNAHAQWFVDGAGYMSAVADAMEAAKEEIFITDWWLSPEIYMKRPMTEGDRWRLDSILKRKAEEGVKIFIILFKEVEVALGINSFYSKSALIKLHPTNIKVLRHPDVVTTGIVLWSHHEKMVVIDQRIAFLGGIDLCFGRYDTQQHRLTDLGSILASPDLELPNIAEEPVTPSTASSQFAASGAQTPVYDRSVSSHSWPETEADRAKLGLRRSEGSDEPDGHLTEKHQRLQKRLTAISEVSIQNVMPEIAVEGVESGETDTDRALSGDSHKPQESSEAHEGSAVENTAVSTTRSPPDEGDFQATSPIPSDACPNVDDGRHSKTTAPGANLSSADEKDPELRDSSIPGLHNVGVHADDKLTRQVSTVSGHVNHAAVFTPTREPKARSRADDIDLVVPQVEHQVSASPKKTLGTTGGTNNNIEVAEGKGERPTETTQTSGWKKLRAIKYLQLWQKGDDSDSDDTENYEKRIKKRGKRPPNLQLQRQGRVDDEGLDMLNIPPGAIKPTTPKPRKKIAQKAHNMKVDIKERFRKKQSKSVDVAGDTEFDYSFYKTLEDNGHPEGILQDMGLEGSTKIWIGKDYVNFISKDFVELDKPFTDLIDRTKTPRMPWHDIAAVVYGKPARDVARHFIQRWNFTKVQKRKTNAGYPLLLPKCYTKVTVPRGALASSIPCKVQVLRSASSWSAGIANTEQSIHNAYIDLITNAKHYIYIENQFFISIAGHNQLHNKIAEALFDRIMKAHECGEVFRVYVVMPLLPAFEGELGTTTGGAIQAIQHWNYSSICREGKSLLERLANANIPNPQEYISFYGLRNHEELGSNLVTELVYVHSKLMIVDDRSVIIGSANINDRSLLGDRDSELAIITEDTRMRKSRMNGEDYEAGWFASGLRQSLFREHLGVSVVNPDINIIDPVISSFYHDEWAAHAAVNTQVYEEVFRCIPTDAVNTFSELTEYQKTPGTAQTNPSSARARLVQVKGNLVQFPLSFLSAARMQPAPITKEGLAPAATWT